MKKLLIVPAFGALAWLASCGFTPKVPVPTPADVIQQAHDAFPSAPVSPQIIVPTFPTTKVKPHASVGRPVRPSVPHHQPSRPQARPHVDPAPVETVPQQQGPVCIFPLNFVPNCTPEPAGRLP